jgi:hypothetical protein
MRPPIVFARDGLLLLWLSPRLPPPGDIAYQGIPFQSALTRARMQGWNVAAFERAY